MKETKLIFLLLAAMMPLGWTAAQTGVIYAYLKHVSEENSPTATTPPDYSFVLKNSSGTTISSFSLNDQATDDNVPNSGNYLSAYDMGLSHGTGGDGQLWAVAGTALGYTEGSNSTGTIYYRSAGSSNWVSTGITGAYTIDGAYANQCVYIAAGNVYFYYNGSSTKIYNGGNAFDVTANGGQLAISIQSTGAIEVYSNTYTATAAPATGGTWRTLTTTGSYTRIDMNLGGSSIAYQTSNNGNQVFTVTVPASGTGTVASLGYAGTKAGVYYDVAYDDLGTIYAVANTISGGTTSHVNQDCIYRYNGSSWTAEAQSAALETITAGAAHLVYGINMEGNNSCNSIFSRQSDNAGNIYWIDDERIKKSSALNGNAFVMAVAPGTYTLTETLPSSSAYDLGRYNIYDPGGSTTGNVNTQVVTYVVTANEVVFAEYINEALVPRAIALTCTFQYLQTFDATTSSPIYTYTFGSGTYGSNIEGTSYHFWTGGKANDGYYMLAQNLTTTNWFSTTNITSDHTGNGGYFLVVNASYAQDEFYRQRVTNLVPGLTYTISFWAANASPTAVILPSVTYGLQDTLGNIVNSASTGTFTSNSWAQYSFIFTATTSRADLFLKNDNIGGSGNDVAIDDISINPILPSIGSNSGGTTECVGSNYTFTNSPGGGIWTSSNKTVATINAKSGSTKAVGAGTAVLTYTYTNSIGCTVTANSTVSVTAPPVVTATDKFGGSVCLGQPDSLYTNFTTTSTAPYTYAWSVSPTSGVALTSTATQNTSATATTAGTYTFTTYVTDSLGCAATASVAVVASNKTAPTVAATANITSAACISPAALTLNGGVSGSLTPNYSYVWSGPGTIVNPSSGSISATSYNTTASSSTAGHYTLTVTDGNGCVGTATTATSSPAPLAVTVGRYAASECSNTVDSVFATATGGTGTLTYAWTNTGTAVTYSPTGATAAREQVSFTTAGTYTFTGKVTDASGCTATGNTSIAYIASSGPTVSGLNAAANICLGSTVNLSGTVTNALTEKLTGTVIGVASTDGYPPSNAFDGLTGTFYDGGTSAAGYWTGLSLSSAMPITQISYYPRATFESRMVGGVFQGSNDPTFTTGVVTLYTITTTPTDVYTTVNITNTTAFQYVRYLSPANGWGNVAEIDFYSNSYLWGGTPTGSGLASTTTNPTTAVPTAAGAYTYTLAVTDPNGCTAQGTTGTQTVNPAITVVATGVNPAFCGTTSTDQLLAIASGGSGTYSTYTWATPTTVVAPGTSTLTSSSIYNPVASLSGAATGSDFKYTVTVTDNNGCTGTGTTSDVVVAGAPTISSVTATASSTCATNTTTINLSGAFSGGTSPYNYAWTAPTNSTVTASSGTATTSPITASATAPVAQNYTYGLTIVDANNCTATGSDAASPVVLGSSLTVTASASTAGPICFSPATSINLTSSASGGSGTYTYAWAGPGGTITTATSQNPTAVPTTTGTYTVTVNDGAGCTGTGTTAAVTVDQATPSISISCGTNASGTNYAQLSESNGTSWLWTTTSGGRFYTSNALSANSDGNTSTLQAPFIDFNGTYSVAITDANGCNGSGSIPVSPSSCSGNILAISGLNFTAEKENNTALLAWSTASETNNSYFNIERSSDGSTWQVIGTVNAQGNSATLTKYSFTDALPLAGSNYYRLKQVDVNGQYSYSPVKYLVFTGQWLVKLYPNPVQNYLVLEFNNGRDEKANIVIQGVLGNTVYATEQQLTAGLNRIVLNQAQQLAAGTYILVMGTTENTFRSKFVKGGN